MKRSPLTPEQRRERNAALRRTVVAWLIVAAVLGGWALVEIFDGGIAQEPQWMTTKPATPTKKGTP